MTQHVDAKSKLGRRLNQFKGRSKSKYKPHIGEKQTRKCILYQTVAMSCGREVMNTKKRKLVMKFISDNVKG